MHVNACMPALQIRDVPEEIRDALAQRARERGQSLQAYLLALVENQARRSRNLALLDRFSDRSDGTRLMPEAAARAVAGARAERENRLVHSPRDRSGGAARATEVRGRETVLTLLALRAL